VGGSGRWGEKLLGLYIQAGKERRPVTEKELEIVMWIPRCKPKAVAIPRMQGFYLKALHALVRIAAKHEIKLRQSYTKSAKGAHFLHGRYRKAKQFRRAARNRRS